MEVLPTVDELLDEAIKIGEENGDKAIFYGSWVMAMRRRVKAALVMLDQGRPDAAKQMLEQALADDGKFIRQKIDKVMKKFRDEHGI